jgi:hypothetical protein
VTGPADTAARFRDLAERAGAAAEELTQMRERLALPLSVDRHALTGAIDGANGCRTWCEFLERRAGEAAVGPVSERGRGPGAGNSGA